MKGPDTSGERRTMKYKVMVSLGGDMEGEYDGVEYSNKYEALKKADEAINEPRVLDAWLHVCDEECD